MKRAHSCGAVVFPMEGGVPKYVLIKSIKGALGFPQGHMEAGETETQTALREIREEVGLNVRLIDGFRHETQYLLPDKADTVKLVTYFLATYAGQTPVPQPGEVTQIRVVPYAEARQAVTHDGNKVVLEHADRFIRENVTVKP